MKSRLLQFFGLCLLPFVPLPADEPGLTRPSEQLDQLFGPIALYPDALIAIILPASTVPSDIVLAARYLESNGELSDVDAQPWDDSVKSLIHYPDIIHWMDGNLNWTKQAGEAFLVQPADVMNAIQRLRARARAAGSLTDTPQQRVVVEDETIQIVPSEPDIIYVPIYDPDIVYISRPGYYSDPFLTFGLGYSTGFWLGYNMDWRHRRIWTVDRLDRPRYWREHRDWRRPSFPGPDHGYRGRLWAPSPHYPRPLHRPGNRPRPEIAHPMPRPQPSRPHHFGPDRVGPPRTHRLDAGQPPVNRRRENRPPPAPNANNPRPSALTPNVTRPSVQATQPPTPSVAPSQNFRRDRPPERREARGDRGESSGNVRNPPGRIQQAAPSTGAQPSARPAGPPVMRASPERAERASPAAQPRSAPATPRATQTDRDGPRDRSPRG